MELQLIFEAGIHVVVGFEACGIVQRQSHRRICVHDKPLLSRGCGVNG